MPHWRIQVPQGIDEPHLESTAILEEMVCRCLIQCPALIATEAPHDWIGCNINMQHVDSTSVTFLQLAPRISTVRPVADFKSVWNNLWEILWTKQFLDKNGKTTWEKQHINQTLIKNIVQTHKKNMLKHLAPTLVGQESVTFLRLKFRETSKQTNVLRL